MIFEREVCRAVGLWWVCAALGGCGGAPVQPVITAPAPEPAAPAALRPLVTDVTLPPVEPAPDTGSAPGEPVFTSGARNAIASLSFDPSGALLAALSVDGTLLVLDARTGEVRASRKRWTDNALGRSVRFDASGTRLLVTGPGANRDAGEVGLWNLASDTWVTLERSFALPADAAALGHDGRRVAFLDPAEQEGQHAFLRVRALDGGAAGALDVDLGAVQASAVVWTPGGALAVASNGGVLHAYDPSTGAQLDDAAAGATTDDLVAGLAARPSGGLLAVRQADGSLGLRDPRDLSLRATFPARGENDEAWVAPVLTWAPDGETLAVIGGGAGAVLRDGRTGAERATLRVGGSGSYTRHAWSPDGGVLYTFGDAGLLRWDARSGRALAELDALDRSVPESEVAVSPDGTVLALGKVDGTIVLVDARSGRARSSLPGGLGEHALWGASWGPRGGQLLTWARGGVELWDAEGGRTAPCFGAGEASFAAGGALLRQGAHFCELATRAAIDGPTDSVFLGATEAGRVLSMRGNQLTLRDVRSTTETPVSAPLGDLSSVLLAPDDAHFAVQSQSGLGIIDVRSGRYTAVAGVPPGIVHAWSGNGRVFASLAADGALTVLTADARVRARVAASLEDRPDAPQLALTPDGAVAVVWSARVREGGNHGVLAVYDAVRGRAGATVDTGPFAGGLLRVLSTGATATLLAPTGATQRLTHYALPAATELAHLELGPGSLELSRAGDRVASCEPSGELVVRDARSGTSLARLGPQCAQARGLAFDPDARFLAVLFATSTRVFRVADGQSLWLRTWHGPTGVVPYATAPDGTFQCDPTLLGAVRYRPAGSIVSAVPTTVDAQHASFRPELLRSFFAPPAGRR